MKKFTVITDVFYKLDIFKHTISAIINQSYQNLEIIIIDNGSSDDIKKYISYLEKQDSRIKVISYKNNVFDFDDPMSMIKIIQNALLVSSGEYVFYNAYDDVMAYDYIQRMANLFNENKDSISAAGLPVSIDIYGKPNQEELNERSSNFRPRHMPGHLIAEDLIKKDSQNLYSAPGSIFSFRTKKLIELGGFHSCFELGQILGVVPFGETSFDPKAIFYWRRHDNQLNLELTKQGFNDIPDFKKLLKDFEIEKKWDKKFSAGYRNIVIEGHKNKVFLSAAGVMLINLSNLNFKGSLRPLRDGFKYLLFWKSIFLSIAINYKLYILNLILKLKPFLKPIFYIFDLIFGWLFSNFSFYKKIKNHLI
tara:strand:- start:180 stop:1271 length:1092 start_codon:yes stop_codon:yes gene_type:complete